MKKDFDKISYAIDSSRTDMIKTMSEMISIKAVSAKSGGKGESERAGYLESVLKGWGIQARRYSYKDETGTERPSLVASIGKCKSTIWIVAHIDTVAEGDISLWSTDPFKAHIDGDMIYGRGTNDDGQAVISSMYAMKALKDSEIELGYNYGLVLAANEEEGSAYGMQKLMLEGIFAEGDMFVVPDWCTADGSAIEIGEKGMLWLKITVDGKQAHASTPEEGKNAFRYMVRFLGRVDELLHNKYTKENRLFRPDYSTFEMTKHEKNVDSINILPGRDVAYIDSRVLPEYKLDEVMDDVKSVASSDEFRDVKITIDVVNREDPAPVTSSDAEIVKMLAGALEDLRGIKPELVGIGGGTCAAFPRKGGMQAATWMTGDEVAHRPNEYAKISDMVNDAKVLAYLFV